MNGLLTRMLGAACLNPHTFEEIEADPRATFQAVIVVILVSISAGIGGVLRPGIVHRIDKMTSGLLIVAKNDFTHLSLSEQFKLHTITRKYQALVWGIPNNQLIEGYIDRHKINRKKMN